MKINKRSVIEKTLTIAKEVNHFCEIIIDTILPETYIYKGKLTTLLNTFAYDDEST